MRPVIDVHGYCPMGCGQTLHLLPSGFIVCLRPDGKCPDKGVVNNILADTETAHVVRFEELDDGAWSAKHPLRERADDQLLNCGISQAVEDFVELCHPLSLPGRRYRVSFPGGHPEEARWEELDVPPAAEG